MSVGDVHPDDAPPTEVGIPVEAEEFIAFCMGPDGKFFIDCAPDDQPERIWQLVTLGLQALEKHYDLKRPLVELPKRIRGIR